MADAPLVEDPVLAAMRAHYATQAALLVGCPGTVVARGGGPGAPGLLPAAAGLLAAARRQVAMTAELVGRLPPGLASGSGPAAGAVLPTLAPLQPGLTGSARPATAGVAAAASRLQQPSPQQGLAPEQQRRGDSPTPPEEAAARIQRLKEERAKKEQAVLEEAERQRCHLHKKPNKSCKFCQRHKDFVTKVEEDKAAMREKFISDARNKGRGDGKLEEEAKDKVPTVELANPKTFGFPPLLQSHIVESTHFRTLMDFVEVQDIVNELNSFADTLEPYLQNSQSTPSALVCCVYRLLAMGIGGTELRRLLESQEGAYVRCAGFLFVRFGLAAEQFWAWLGEYVLDDEELPSHPEAPPTVGEFVEALLSQERYFNTILPRVPASTKRQIEVHLAGVPQFRRRTQANMRLLDVYRQRGVKVEVCLGVDAWSAGESLQFVETAPTRPKLRVRLENGEEVLVQLGKVILTDSRHGQVAINPVPPNRGSREGRRGRSRSRSPQVDWARSKGKSTQQLVEDLKRRNQDRAVCSSGKRDYARRPVSFQVALPMEQGSASHRLNQDETTVTTAPRRGRDRSKSPEAPSRREPSAEHQARMKQLFEKYGMAKASPATEDGKRNNDIEGPDVVRLG